MSGALGTSAAVAEPPAPDSPSRSLSPRGWFRRRLDHDPRAWVLALAGLEGLAAFALNLQEKRATFYDRGMGLAVLLGFTTVLPAVGVLGMLAHGRLLFWTGKLLRGRAARHEIHAAFAWSQLPFIVTASPLLLEIPLRAAEAESDPVPAWLSAAVRGIANASGALTLAAAAAAIAGAFLYVKFLGEAQRFSSWRALANQTLAAVLGVALAAAGILAAMALQPGTGGFGIVPLALALTVIPALAIERAVIGVRRRKERTRAT